MRKKKQKNIVYFEVLQNGEFLDEATRPYGKRSNIILSSRKGALVLPFYPLSHDIEIAQIDRKGVHVFLDSSWSGFLTAGGQPVEITAAEGEDQVYTLGPGDYGSLNKYDLKVLIKIGPERTEKIVPKNPIYRGKWLDMIVDSKVEGQVIGTATFLSLFIYLCVFGGLWVRPNHSPRSKEELKSKYNLAFVNPNHLRHLPEALQTNLDRSKPIASSIRYYRSMTELFMGYRPKYENLIFKNTSRFYNRIYQDYEYEIDNLVESQLERNDDIQQDQTRATIYIPSIKGETFAGSMIRLRGKMSSLHKTFQDSLETRRKTTVDYVNDHSYNYEEYKTKGLKSITASKIGKIRVFKLVTNEEQMYLDAENLAVRAKVEQQKIKQYREPLIPLRPHNTEPIGIKPDTDYVSFSSRFVFHDNQKIQNITASSFGNRNRNQIKEPLIGEINPKLIDAVINRNRFQLQLCFELALRRNRNVNGRMEWTWRLDSRGKLSDLTLNTSTIKDRRMKRCVRQKIARWKWPRPRKGSVEVTYPFVFRPNRG